uniref:PB1 domain-containing protein n=1 Tax=Steinernema glaseri TaxID=37863 RepID=A0A1I7ZN25_9BILA
MVRIRAQPSDEDTRLQHRIATERLKFNLEQIERKYCNERPCGVIYNVDTGKYEVDASVEDVQEALERSRQMDHSFGDAVISAPDLDENHAQGPTDLYRKMNSKFQQSIRRPERDPSVQPRRHTIGEERRSVLTPRNRPSRKSMFTMTAPKDDRALVPFKRPRLSMFAITAPVRDGNSSREELHTPDRSRDHSSTRLMITEITDEELPPQMLAITYPCTPSQGPSENASQNTRVLRSASRRVKEERSRELVTSTFAQSLYALKYTEDIVSFWSADVSLRTSTGNFEQCETVEKFEQNMRRVYARAKSRNSFMLAGYCTDEPRPRKRRAPQ